jgi:serine protease Do
MSEFQEYAELYPNIPIELLLFFSEYKVEGDRAIHNTIMKFCGHYQKKYDTKNIPQPRVISAICDRLVENGKLSVINKSGPDNINSSYYCNATKELKENEQLQGWLNTKLKYEVFGFVNIYNDYKKFVLPVEFTYQDDRKSLGTCFLFQDGIASARHCFEDASAISIKGIPKEILQNAKYYVYENKLMDLVFIRTYDGFAESIVFSEEANLLDEVMTLGFPQVAGYHNFLAIENATVSARFTASKGQVAAKAEDIWIKEKLLLITAKIKGGNSGGPVINKSGSVIGISVNMSTSDGDYDDLGYGTVIPIEFLNELIYKPKFELDMSKTTFHDFE